ncbi:MAG: glycosyltransferase family 4 protein, partial [Candidatus Pacearchaeota archaeon]|nr:glycosyltransferase family 4 protein [Candidatus Pacearchaeota archaeon]
HKVGIFSTNNVKGSSQESCDFEEYEKIKIHRFKPYLSYGENIKFWNPATEIKKFNPDIIVAEVYRHPHTHQALKIAKKLQVPCILVTHAPFVEPELRSKLNNLIADFYDKHIGSKVLKKFNKIVSITRWEEAYLKELGIAKNKLAYIPNGISEEFFSIPIKKGRDILFLGRISPIKNLEVLIKATAIVKKQNPSVKLRIVGPAEQEYKQKLLALIKSLDLEKNIAFLPAIFDVKKKIAEIDKARIFILPSKREAMPISLIEAMARARIVIASDNKGSAEVIQDKQTGFLYSKEDHIKLAKTIEYCLNPKNKKNLDKIEKMARKNSKKFKWEEIFTSFLSLLNALKPEKCSLKRHSSWCSKTKNTPRFKQKFLTR